MRVRATFASRPCPGFLENGDVVVIRAGRPGLLAVVDGLGHGPQAARAASRAASWLGTCDPNEGIERTMEGLHRALRGTRGAAATVLVFNDCRVQGCGVGNVELRTEGGHISAILTPGILGIRVRRFRYFEGQLSVGMRLFVFSDGISSSVDAHALRSLSPEQACAHALARHGKQHDDATMLIADIENEDEDGLSGSSDSHHPTA